MPFALFTTGSFIITGIVITIASFVHSGSISNDNGVTKDNLSVRLNAQDFTEENGSTETRIEHSQERFERADKGNKEAIGRTVVLRA